MSDAKPIHYFYVGFATSNYFGHAVCAYEGAFDFCDAQEFIEKKRLGEEVAILAVHEISERDFNGLQNLQASKRKKRLSVIPDNRH